MPESAETRSTTVSVASAREADLALRSLSDEPFSITLSRESLQQIRCEPRNYMLVLSEEFSGVDAVQKLQNRKALAGLLALKSPEAERYSTAYVVLTTPHSGQIQVLLKTTNGQTAFAGFAESEGDTLELLIQSVSRPGAVPVAFKATYANGSLTNVGAASAIRTIARRVPQSG